jgi:hypothetical protein
MQAALAADVPCEFLEDVAARHPGSPPPPPPGCKVFDLFRTWRLDSGSYKEMAEVSRTAHLIFAWCRSAPRADSS